MSGLHERQPFLSFSGYFRKGVKHRQTLLSTGILITMIMKVSGKWEKHILKCWLCWVHHSPGTSFLPFSLSFLRFVFLGKMLRDFQQGSQYSAESEFPYSGDRLMMLLMVLFSSLKEEGPLSWSPDWGSVSSHFPLAQINLFQDRPSAEQRPCILAPLRSLLMGVNTCKLQVPWSGYQRMSFQFSKSHERPGCGAGAGDNHLGAILLFSSSPTRD